MCFAAPRGALFRRVNFQKCSENSVLYILTWKCATRHNGVQVSISQLPKVPQACCVLHILASKCASRHNSVQFFISHLARWLRTRRFSEPTFRPSEATNHWKNTVFRDFATFSRTCIFRLCLFLFSDLLSSSLLFSSLTLPTSAFSFVHVVGSLTSKFPSMAYVYLCARIVII